MLQNYSKLVAQVSATRKCKIRIQNCKSTHEAHERESTADFWQQVSTWCRIQWSNSRRGLRWHRQSSRNYAPGRGCNDENQTWTCLSECSPGFLHISSTHQNTNSNKNTSTAEMRQMSNYDIWLKPKVLDGFTERVPKFGPSLMYRCSKEPPTGCSQSHSLAA